MWTWEPAQKRDSEGVTETERKYKQNGKLVSKWMILLLEWTKKMFKPERKWFSKAAVRLGNGGSKKLSNWRFEITKIGMKEKIPEIVIFWRCTLIKTLISVAASSYLAFFNRIKLYYRGKTLENRTWSWKFM